MQRIYMPLPLEGFLFFLDGQIKSNWKVVQDLLEDSLGMSYGLSYI